MEPCGMLSGVARRRMYFLGGLSSSSSEESESDRERARLAEAFSLRETRSWERVSTLPARTPGALAGEALLGYGTLVSSAVFIVLVPALL